MHSDEQPHFEDDEDEEDIDEEENLGGLVDDGATS